jgi:hypothetical protein
LSDTLFLVRHLLALVLLAGAAFGCADHVTARLRVMDSRERWLVSLVVGLGMLATLFLALGAIGLLYPAIVWLVLLPLFALGMRGGAAWVLGHIPRRLGYNHLRSPTPRTIMWLVSCYCARAGSSSGAYPPTAFDATFYHLPYARTFVDSGRLVFASGLRYPVFPQLNEMLFTVMLLVSDDVSGQLVQTFAALLTAMILISWGLRARTPTVGWLAAALWLGSPIVVYFSSTACIEYGFALFVTAGLWASERWREHQEREWLVLAAAFAGFAAATKYLGLLAVALVLAFILRRPSAMPGGRSQSLWRFRCSWRCPGTCGSFYSPAIPSFPL